MSLPAIVALRVVEADGSAQSTERTVAVPPAPTLDNVRITNIPWRDAPGVSLAAHNGVPALALQPGRYPFTIARGR